MVAQLLLAAGGEHKLVLIGGQAFNFWAEAFRKVEPTLEAGLCEQGRRSGVSARANLRSRLAAARAKLLVALIGLDEANAVGSEMLDGWPPQVPLTIQGQEL